MIDRIVQIILITTIGGGLIWLRMTVDLPWVEIIRFISSVSIVTILVMVWRTYVQARFAITRMLEMEQGRTALVTDLKMFSEGLAELLEDLRKNAEMYAKKQAAIADTLSKKVEATGTLLTKQLTGIGEKLQENTELTKQVGNAKKSDG